MLAAGVHDAGVLAAGGGWAWCRHDDRVVHLTGPRGPRGPLTAVVDELPALAPGDRVRLDTRRAAPWRTPAPPPPAAADAIRDAILAVRPHVWNDPRALGLGDAPLSVVGAGLIGRGPGLTPAGDDALAGFVYARRATAHPERDEDRAAVARLLAATGEPSRSLLAAAARGEVFSPAADMLAALLRADGAALAPRVRALAGLGRTTGRALLTGMVRALESSA